MVVLLSFSKNIKQVYKPLNHFLQDPAKFVSVLFSQIKGPWEMTYDMFKNYLQEAPPFYVTHTSYASNQAS